MTAEEWMQSSNERLHAYRGNIQYPDTSDYVVKTFNGEEVNQTVSRFENFNWMVEVDPVEARAIRKNYNMGRFGHEGGTAMDDQKTVYLTDDSHQDFL